LLLIEFCRSPCSPVRPFHPRNREFIDHVDFADCDDILLCPTLNDIREEHLYTLKCYLNSIQEGAYEAICENKQLIQLILDSSMDILKGIVTLTKKTI
jgi:hypothetical protein